MASHTLHGRVHVEVFFLIESYFSSPKEAALGRVSRPPPAVSLLEIHVPSQNWPEDGPAAGAVTSLLRAAALLAPEKLVFTFPLDSHLSYAGVDLPCFHRATSIVLEWIPFVLAGGEYPALQTLSIRGCEVDDLGALLSLCPHLRALRLIWLGGDDDRTTVHSTSLQELVMEAMWARRVDIVAPMLKQLTVSLHAYEQASISILAPMVEKVSWQCLYQNRTIWFGLWCLEKLSLQTAEAQEQLPSLHIHACSDIDVCHAVCPCQPTNWRTQIIALTALEEVEIDGFEGEDHELDFLKLVFSCAPMLKTMVVKLSDEVSSVDDRCTKIYDIFRGYSSVKCNVYIISAVAMCRSHANYKVWPPQIMQLQLHSVEQVLFYIVLSWEHIL
uniref:Uncharacterized protein n=1 Tax=Aegilops tauschii TaxID=37682 RepID=M8BJ72_AEGTA